MYYWLAGGLLVASYIIYRLFRRPSPVPPQSRQFLPIAPAEYQMLKRYQMHYSTWSTIPTQESLPTYTPASQDPSVTALLPQVRKDILEALGNK